MEDEQPDSLEGWVPVREDLFAEPERHQLRFLVAWNDAEGKFAVTCHDRTAQRRRQREGSRPGPPPEPEPTPPPSWAGLLSAAGLRGAHQQLAALWPPLERCFPPLPPELEAGGGGLWGLWALVWPAREGPGEAALQELCARLERYLGQAAEGCGGAAVRDALLPADGGAPDCESPRAFRERALRARLAEADARLRQVRRRGPALSQPSVPGPSRAGGGRGRVGLFHDSRAVEQQVHSLTWGRGRWVTGALHLQGCRRMLREARREDVLGSVRAQILAEQAAMSGNARKH